MWGTSQNFFFVFIDELEKQSIIEKTVDVGHWKINILNNFKHDLQFQRYRVKQTEIGNFTSFFALNPPKKHQKSKFWIMKKFAWDIIISHICDTNHNHMMYRYWDME